MAVLGAHQVAVALWWVGLVLWFGVMYTFFTAVTVRSQKPTLARGINGAWLIASVATQSAVVLRAVVDAGAPPHEAIQFLAIAMFMIGSMLCLAIIPLIFYRLTFVPLRHAEFGPLLDQHGRGGDLRPRRLAPDPAHRDLAPGRAASAVHQGFTFFFWAVATWWIPFLFALMAWRYLWKGDRFRDQPALWGLVFPLGMYTTTPSSSAARWTMAFSASSR